MKTWTEMWVQQWTNHQICVIWRFRCAVIKRKATLLASSKRSPVLRKFQISNFVLIHFETNIVCFASNQATFSFCLKQWLTREVFLCPAEVFFKFIPLLCGSYLWCKARSDCQTNQNHPRHLSLSDAIIAKASTGRSVPTIVIADTKHISTHHVLIHWTNVRLPSLSERTYQPEYYKNMLCPALVIYVTMLVIFAAMASTMHGTFILQYT